MLLKDSLKDLIKKKFGIEHEFIPWVIISLVVLGIFIAGYFVLKNKGSGAIEYIKVIFKFGR